MAVVPLSYIKAERPDAVELAELPRRKRLAIQGAVRHGELLGPEVIAEARRKLDDAPVDRHVRHLEALEPLRDLRGRPGDERQGAAF